jgi:hypothetical protein
VATQRDKRYGSALDSMLKHDLSKLDENRRNDVPNVVRDNDLQAQEPHQENGKT